MKHTPKLNSAYWLTIMTASVFGANLGDYMADALNLGHVKGLPLLAVLLAGILIAERFIKTGGALFYWAAIIVIRAAATNIGDALHHAGIDFQWSIPATILLMMLVVGVWHATAKKISDNNAIRVNSYYWLTMILAGVAGTLAGDYASHPLHFGFLGSMLAYAALLGILFLIGRGKLATHLAYYWTAIVLIRSGGTAAGDLIAHGLNNITVSTAITGVIFLALVLVFYGPKNGRNISLAK